MTDDYERLERLSKNFQDKFISNQKKLNEIRVNQFQSMLGDNPKVNFNKIREKYQEFQRREKLQRGILTDEMNMILLQKIKEFEKEESFKNKEPIQRKILLEEIDKEESKQITSTLKQSAELRVLLLPLVVHVDILLQKQALSEKQKNHLKIVRQHILSDLDVFGF